MRMAWRAMQMHSTSFIASTWVWNFLIRVHLHEADVSISWAANHPVSILGLVFIARCFLQLRQETAAIQVDREHHLVILRISALAVGRACAFSHWVWEAIHLFTAKIWIVQLKVWVICARRSFALNQKKHFILAWNPKLLRICSCHYDFPSTWTTSCHWFWVACLTASTNRLLSSFIVLWSLAALVCNRVSHWVNIKVGELLLVRYLHQPFSI